MTTNTGGPAFPCEFDYIGTNREAANGMTLRDYFAAKAMQAIFNTEFPTDSYSSAARVAYNMADAMLKAREA